MNDFFWEITPPKSCKNEFPGSFNDFFVTFDRKYGIFLYDILELKMDAYYCKLAIYRNDNLKKPCIDMNTEKRGVFYRREMTFDYAPISNCISISFSAYKNDSGGQNFPYLFIDISTSKFAFIPWDHTSIYYGLSEVSHGKFVIYDKSPLELDFQEKSQKHIRQTGRQIELANYTWYDTENLNRAYEISHT